MLCKRYSIHYSVLGPGLQNTWLMSLRKPAASFPFISQSFSWLMYSKPCRTVTYSKLKLSSGFGPDSKSLSRIVHVCSAVMSRTCRRNTLKSLRRCKKCAGLQQKGLVSILDSFPTHLQSCTSPQVQQLYAATHGCIISSKVLPCVIFAATG